MTAITYVSQKEMKKRTGLSTALGYSFPEEDEILVRKGLDPEVKKEVLAHEEEHIEDSTEGPFLPVLAAIGGALGGGGVAAGLIGAGATLLGAKKSSNAAKSAARTAAAGSDREIEFLRESRDLARADQAPYRQAGATALDALMSLTGLRAPGAPAAAAAPQINYGPVRFGGRFGGTSPRGGNLRVSSYAGGGHMYNINELGPENRYSGGMLTRNPNPMTIDNQTGYIQPHIEGRALGGYTGPAMFYDKPLNPYVRNDPSRLPTLNKGPANTTAINPATGFPNENPGGTEGGYQFQTDPGYQFRFEEGQRALDRGAAQRGGLLSGGYARKAIRYGQGFASNEFGNVYNRIANIAGLGQVGANQSGGYAMMAGQGMGNAASQGANATAYGQIQSGNAWANAGNQIAQLPWGNMFRRT
jgi:hypothetical protein